MEDYPANLIEFEDRFRTEAECRAYLEKIRWPDGFRCPQCGNQLGWQTGRRGLWECAGCNRQTTVTAGTILEGTRKPLRLWFLAMWLIVSEKNGISAKGLQRQLGFTRYETVWTWLHKLRRAMVRPGRDMLSGRLEVDETYVGGAAEGLRGRGADRKHIVVIGQDWQDSAAASQRRESGKPASIHPRRSSAGSGNSYRRLESLRATGESWIQARSHGRQPP